MEQFLRTYYTNLNPNATEEEILAFLQSQGFGNTTTTEGITAINPMPIQTGGDGGEGITGIDIPNFPPDMNLYAFRPGSLLDKAIKNTYTGYKELGIGEDKLKDLMEKDMKQFQEKGIPLSLPPEAYTLIG